MLSDATRGLDGDAKEESLAAGPLASAGGPETVASPMTPAMQVDSNSLLDEESAFKGLVENVRDQDDLERDITHQAELALIDAEDKRDCKRIEKLEATKTKLESDRQAIRQRLRAVSAGNPALKRRLEAEVTRLEGEIDLANRDLDDFRARIDQRHRHQEGGASASVLPDSSDTGVGGGQRLPNESHREFLIRTGKITPFAKVGGARPEGVEGNLADVVLQAEEEAVAGKFAESAAQDEPSSHRNLRLPGFFEDILPGSSMSADEFTLRPRKKRKTQPSISDGEAPRNAGDKDAEWHPACETSESTAASPSGDASSDDDVDFTQRTRAVMQKQGAVAQKGRAAGRIDNDPDGTVSLSGVDDGNEAVYKQRLEDWVTRRSNARRRRHEVDDFPLDDGANSDDTAEWFRPSPDEPDHVFENGLRLPGDIYPSLFAYQKTAVRWLAELYDMKVGGIIGDEMGLGKTGMARRPPPCTPVAWHLLT